MGVFKGFLSRAYKICTEKYLQCEIDVLIDIFTENGHNKNTLTNIATEYLRNINKPKSKDENKTKYIKNIINLPWVPILGPKLRKNLKRKTLKQYSHQELICSPSSVKISRNLYLIFTRAFIHCNAVLTQIT